LGRKSSSTSSWRMLIWGVLKLSLVSPSWALSFCPKPTMLYFCTG
jgi:hypothetical protein